MAADYSRHEALDRASMLMEMVARFLLEHPFIQDNEHHHQKALAAHHALFVLYQALGEEHLAGKEG